MRFGSRSGSGITSNSADLTIRGDVLNYGALASSFTNTDLSTGWVVMEPHSSAFSAPFDYLNFTLGSTISSLRVGKTTNTAAITVYDPISIAGPITFYGGDLTLRENMTSTLSGADVLIKGRGKVEVVPSDLPDQQRGHHLLVEQRQQRRRPDPSGRRPRAQLGQRPYRGY